MTTMAQEAAEFKFRGMGIPIKIQKPHGFADEWLANTDGISRLLKYTYKYWKPAEPKRLQEQAKALRRLQEAQEVARKAGAIA